MLNYFKPTPKILLKISLALRGLVGTISGAAFFDGNKDAAFWLLVAGAVVDFLIQCFDPNSFKDKVNTLLVLILAGGMIALSSCSSLRPSMNSSRTDSTWTTYRPAELTVPGGSVAATLNLDSLLSAAFASHPLRAENDSSRYGVVPDSLAAEIYNAVRGQLAQLPPASASDTGEGVQLRYWFDQYGKLNMVCSSKDQTIQMLVAEVNRLRKEEKVVTTVEHVDTWYTWAFAGWAALATIAAALLFIFKRG